jgi:hypothetical protein
VRVRELLSVCFVLVTALLVWPLLGIPNRLTLVGGIPALVLYLFTVWAGVVAVLVWAARRTGPEDAP